MGQVTVVGSFMYDLVATVPRRPKTGETLVGNTFGMFLGGKGANQAIAASRAGSKVTMVGRLGNDFFGKQFLEKFSREGINTDFVTQDDENGTGVAMPLIDASGDNSIVIIPQANMALTVENINQAQSTIADADVLVMQCEVPMDANQRAAEIAKQNDTLVILNPAPAQLIPDQILKLVDIIIPNEIETETLTGLPTKTENEVLVAGRNLLSKGVETVILTLGDRGSLLLNEGGEKLMLSRLNIDSFLVLSGKKGGRIARWQCPDRSVGQQGPLHAWWGRRRGSHQQADRRHVPRLFACYSDG
jgi:ribokinase